MECDRHSSYASAKGARLFRDGTDRFTLPQPAAGCVKTEVLRLLL
jgi:hypothetical protein